VIFSGKSTRVIGMSMSEERSKLQIIVWIVLAMVAEAVIVLLPIACAISGKGFIAMWGAISKEQFIVIFGFVVGLVVGLVTGLSLDYGLIGGLYIGLVTGLIAGLALGLNFGLGSGLSFGIIFVANYGLVVGLIFGISTFIGCLLGFLLFYVLGSEYIFEGFTSTFVGYLRLWQLETYSLRKAIASFVLVYMVVVIVFALWFNACYLESPEEYFDIGDKIKNPNLWDFIYFSFVTITTLGYGDISPLHTFPQVLIIAETMTGLGLIVGYLGIIVHVGGQEAQQKSDNS